MAMASSTATGSSSNRHRMDPTRWCAWAHRGHRLWASMPEAFWVYVYKVQLCPELKSRHDWRRCPYAHHGERARRRHPDRYPYLPVHCPDHRDPPPPPEQNHAAAPRRAASSCARGLDCQYAHGAFELWLHPSRFRTRMCDAGAGCRRRVCFFAHSGAELSAEDDPVPRVELPPPAPPRALRARTATAPAPRSLPRQADQALQARPDKVRLDGGGHGASSLSAPPAAAVAVADTVALEPEPEPVQPQASPEGQRKEDETAGKSDDKENETAGKSGGDDASEDGFVAGDYPYIDLIWDMI